MEPRRLLVCCRLTLIDILQPTNPAPPRKTCLNLIVTPLPCTKTLRVPRPADHTLTSLRKARYPRYRATPNAIGQKFIAEACPLLAIYTHGYSSGYTHQRSTMNEQGYHGYTYSYTGCFNCGERNHKRANCRYAVKLRCATCGQWGHKSNLCTARTGQI